MRATSTPGRALLADALVVAAAWAFVAFGSTAQRWTGLDTPDSEFYATLGLFGSDVTDRAPYPVYYWTRFGTILPVRALTGLWGPWTGYHVFWLLLLAVTTIAVFVLARRFTTRFVAGALTVLVSLNTVWLGMAGNPYVSGTAMAGTFVLIASVACLIPRDGARPADGSRPRAGVRVLAPLTGGAALGWLLMTNPYATMLAGCVWAVGLAVVAGSWPPRRLRPVARVLGLTAAGAAATFLVLLLLGRTVFPGMDWLQTNLYWSKVLNSADYVTDVWSFRRDVVFVVPVVVLAAVGVAALVRRADPALRLAAALTPAAMAFGLGFLIVSPSNTLEIPHYQALQWPPALAAVVLTVAVAAGRRRAPWWVVLAAAFAVAVVIVAGHWTGTLDLAVGWLVGIGLVAVFLLGCLPALLPAWDRGARSLLALVCATGVLFTGFQALQNAHRPLTFSAESPWSNAFVPNDVFATMQSAHDAQRWLIDSTTDDDSVMVWVDADWSVEESLLPMAAFQLWGANQITPLPTLYGDELERARSLRPDVVAMYGRTPAAIWRFWGALPPDVRSTDPVCSEYPWPDPKVPTAHVCLARLSWR